jgi:RNA polymerase sigma factor (sigma-70 family)
VLLDRFLLDRNEAAFTTLVSRHGPLVLRLCRRWLRQEHDVEDAFQATFLVLARWACAIRGRDSLAAWLHGVAYRVASRLRTADSRRQQREAPCDDLDPLDPHRDPLEELSARELLGVMDEEVQQLPHVYRLPVVLCCLEGKSQEEAARLLAWTIGSVKGRLERGRKRLRERLARRGLNLPAALAVVSIGQGAASAGVPAALVGATVRAALVLAARSERLAGAIPARVAALAEAGLTGMVLRKVKIAMGLVLLAGVLGTGVGLAVYQARTATSGPGQEAVMLAPMDAEPHGSQEDGSTRTDLYGDPLPLGAITRLGTVRYRHGQRVRSVAFSPDGKLIASAGADYSVRLWDRATGREVRRFIGHKDIVNFVCFTPDGKILITSSGDPFNVKDPSIRFWNAATGQEVGRLFAAANVRPITTAVALSPDGKVLAAGQDDRILLVGVPYRQSQGVLPVEKGKVMCVRFSPDGQCLAAVIESVGVCLFDLKTKQIAWQNTDQPYLYQGLQFAPDGRTLAVSTAVRQPIRLLDAATGKEVLRFKGPHPGAWPFAFSHDGKRLFSDGWGRNGIIWDVATGKPSGALDPPLSSVRQLVLSPDGRVLAEAGNRAVRFWDATTGKGIAGPEGAQDMIDAIALSPDGRTLLTASHFDRQAGPRLWDLATGRQRLALVGQESSRAAAFSPDGRTFAAGCYDQTPTLADTATGMVIRRCEGKRGLVDSLVFTADGKRLLSSGWIDTAIRLWDPATGKELPRLGELPKGGGARCLALSPDGAYLATGGMDRIIRLWDLAARKEVRQLVGQQGSIWALAFAPDGKRLAAVTATGTFNFNANGTDPVIRVWDIATGEQLQAMQGPPAGSWSVAWSPDARVIASGGEDHVIRLWEVMTGQERARLSGHEGPVSALAFTQEGRRLISGSSDTTLLVWDLVALRPAKPPAAQDIPALWADLAHPDAAVAFRALSGLAAAPGLSVSWLKERLRPIAAPNSQRLARLIARLDDVGFTSREEASRELESLDELAAPALREAQKHPSAEVRRRAKQLLSNVRDLGPGQVQKLRAVEVLEQIGTPPAQRILESIAKGAPAGRLTQEAKASLERLARRPSSNR